MGSDRKRSGCQEGSRGETTSTTYTQHFRCQEASRVLGQPTDRRCRHDHGGCAPTKARTSSGGPADDWSIQRAYNTRTPANSCSATICAIFPATSVCPRPRPRALGNTAPGPTTRSGLVPWKSLRETSVCVHGEGYGQGSRYLVATEPHSVGSKANPAGGAYARAYRKTATADLSG